MFTFTANLATDERENQACLDVFHSECSPCSRLPQIY